MHRDMGNAANTACIRLYSLWVCSACYLIFWQISLLYPKTPITRQRLKEYHFGFCLGIIHQGLLYKIAQRAALFRGVGYLKKKTLKTYIMQYTFLTWLSMYDGCQWVAQTFHDKLTCVYMKTRAVFVHYITPIWHVFTSAGSICYVQLSLSW